MTPNITPPHDDEAERAALGAVLIDQRAMADVADQLEVADFYSTRHQEIYRAMLDMYGQGEDIDLVTLRVALERGGALDQVGGSAYLTSLSDVVFSAANVGSYAAVVKDKSRCRQLIDIGRRIMAEAASGGAKPGDVLEAAESMVLALSARSRKSDFIALSRAVKDAINRIEKLSEAGSDVTGVTTGFLDLDQTTAGLQSSDMIVVAGATSVGKTALALNIAVNAARAKHIVAFVSMEMGAFQLAARLLSMESGLSSHHLRVGRIRGDGQWRAMLDAGGRLYLPLFIGTGSFSVPGLRSKLRRRKLDEGVDLVVVDYLQLLRSGSRSENRTQEVGAISRGLKAIAMELDVPLIAISQLNRSFAQRTNKRPQLSDLRESGTIEQDADAVMFLYRDEVYNKQTRYPGVAEVIIDKQRNGPTGTVYLRWNARQTLFQNLGHDELERMGVKQ